MECVSFMIHLSIVVNCRAGACSRHSVLPGWITAGASSRPTYDHRSYSSLRSPRGCGNLLQMGENDTPSPKKRKGTAHWPFPTFSFPRSCRHRVYPQSPGVSLSPPEQTARRIAALLLLR